MFRSANAFYLSLVAVAVFALGVAGLSYGNCQLPEWQDRIAETLKLFVHAGTATSCTPSWTLSVARYAAPYVVPFVALFATLRLAFTNVRHDIRVARARYKHRHFIVCGLGDTGMQVVENLRKSGDEVIAIDLVTDSPHAAAADRNGVPVLKGDAAERSVLDFAGLPQARAVVICTGEDAANVDIALRIEEAVRDRRRSSAALTVLVELRHEWLFAKLIDHDKEPLGSAEVEVRPFNIYQNAARLLVQQITPQPATAAAARPVIIVGFGSMGREVTLHLIRAAPVPLDSATKIVVLDRIAEDLGRNFIAGLPSIEQFSELKFVTAEVNVDAAEKWGAVQTELSEVMPLAVAVCLPDDKVSLFVALRLRAFFDERGQFEMPVFVRLRRHHRLGEFAAHIERLPKLNERLRVFGSLEELLSPDILIGSRLDGLAKACHQRYLDALPADEAPAPNSRPWPALPEHFKMSSRREADHIGVKLAQAGFTVAPSPAPDLVELTEAETETLARLEHRRWSIERRLRGWQYGPIRDDAQHLNPNLVEWDKLPERVRAGNRASIAALPRMLALAGLEIRRQAADPVQPGGLGPNPQAA